MIYSNEFIIIWRRSLGARLKPTSQRILDYFLKKYQEEPGIAIRVTEVCRDLDIISSNIYRYLKELTLSGLIVRRNRQYLFSWDHVFKLAQGEELPSNISPLAPEARISSIKPEYKVLSRKLAKFEGVRKHSVVSENGYLMRRKLIYG